jgi:5-methylthioadenosine/S-adenosylhomocysteine deaminase
VKEPKELDLLIEGGTIITVNKRREIIEDGALAIDEGRIVAVGKKDDVRRIGKADKVLDARGKVVIPGLVNIHTHIFQTLLKGIGDDMKLLDWIRNLQPKVRSLTKEDMYVAAQLASVEMIRSGTTCCLDFTSFNQPEFADQEISALRESGIRATLGRTILDTGEEMGLVKESIQPSEDAVKDCERLVSKYHNTEEGRIRIMIGITTTWLCTEEGMHRAREFATTHNTGLTLHIGETQDERNISVKRHGMPEIEYALSLGILGPDVIAAHCVWVNDKELDYLQRTGTSVAHNPESNMYLASGIAPIHQMLSAGINVGLACDGAASNNNQDMFEAMRIAAFLQKVKALDPTVITAGQVLDMATINGAKALGLEKEIGSLETGKKADVVLVDLMRPNTTPTHNALSSLVYCANGDNVNSVIVDGHFLMEDGELRETDEEEIVRRGQRTSENLVRRAT